MKPIGRQFGLWTLLICGFGMSFTDQPTGAAICLVGAVLFDAIKAMDKGVITHTLLTRQERRNMTWLKARNTHCGGRPKCPHYVIKQRDDGVYLCIMCGAPVPEYEPEMCCDGRECGCMGLPTEPPLCSFECGEKLHHPKAN